MAQTLLLNVSGYEFVAGVNTTNPLGYRMKVSTQQDEKLRIYFYSPDVATPKLVGWRAFDGALVLFLRPRDYDSLVLLLDQAKATYIRFILEGNVGDEDIQLFELSSAPFPAAIPQEEADAAEFDRRVARG